MRWEDYFHSVYINILYFIILGVRPMQTRCFFMAKRVCGGSLYYNTLTENGRVVQPFYLCWIYRAITAVHSHCDPIDMCEHVANHLKFHSIKFGLQTLIPTAQSLAQFSYSYLIVTIIHSIHLSRSGSYVIWINFLGNVHENIYKKDFEKEFIHEK